MRGSLYLGRVEVWAERRDSRMSWRAWSPYMVEWAVEGGGLESRFRREGAWRVAMDGYLAGYSTMV